MTPETATKPPAQSKAKAGPKTRKPPREDSVLDTIHANQEAIVDLTEQWVDSIGEIVPNLWNKKIVEGAPAIHEITDAAFDLTRKVLDAQLDFTKRLVDSIVAEVKKLN